MNLGRFEIDNIYNEDCYKAIKDIPDKSVDCIYTDIPYLFTQGSAKKNSSKTDENKTGLQKRIQRLMGSELKDIIDGIDYAILDEFVRIMKKINIFIWCSRLQIPAILNFFVELGYKFEILVWCKDNPTPMVDNVWLPDLEYCLYFRESGVALNDGYNLKSKWYSSPINKRDKDKFEHPTIKPLELVRRHLLHTTQPNDIVL